MGVGYTRIFYIVSFIGIYDSYEIHLTFPPVLATTKIKDCRVTLHAERRGIDDINALSR